MEGTTTHYLSQHIFDFDPVQFTKRFNLDSIENAAEVFVEGLKACRSLEACRNKASSIKIKELVSNSNKIFCTNEVKNVIARKNLLTSQQLQALVEQRLKNDYVTNQLQSIAGSSSSTNLDTSNLSSDEDIFFSSPVPVPTSTAQKRRFDTLSEDEQRTGIPSRETETGSDDLVEFDSFTTEETDVTYKTEQSTGYGENYKSKKYILSLHELKRVERKLPVYIFDISSSLDERLSISSIQFNTVLSAEYKLVSIYLTDEEYTHLRAWRRCVMEDKTYFPPYATTVNQLNMNNLLCHVAETVCKDDQKSEIGFIVEDVSPFFRYLFPVKGPISLKWEKSSFKPASNDCKRLRLDFILFSNDQEIGCGEVKICNDDSELLESDRARIAETMKRQLHVRILGSRHEKEMKIFGIICKDHILELYSICFDKNAEIHYQLYKLQTLTIPSSRSTYHSMDETLEHLLSFKNMIISSLPEPEDIHNPLIHYEYSSLFKPTLNFKKE